MLRVSVVGCWIFVPGMISTKLSNPMLNVCSEPRSELTWGTTESLLMMNPAGQLKRVQPVWLEIPCERKSLNYHKKAYIPECRPCSKALAMGHYSR